MFVVYDNGKKAQYPEHGVDPSWDNAAFKTLKEAVDYAYDWLGWHSLPQFQFRLPVEVIMGGYDYDGYGSIIQIREEN